MQKIAIVTGCSSGFGAAIAATLAEQGFDVVATLRRPEGAAEALRGDHRIHVMQLDVTDAASRSRAVDGVLSRFGRIDVLVNNAGIALRGSIEDTPEDQLRSVMDTNFHGPVEMIRLVLPAMRRQREGRIVNVTAIGALLCSPFLSAYCASKHALDAMTCALDIEVRALGIRAASILPGQFKTAIGANMTQVPVGADYAPVSEALAAKFRERAAEADDDLTPVTQAVLAATLDTEPRPRYVVGKGSALLLPPVIRDLEDIHRVELERAEVGG